MIVTCPKCGKVYDDTFRLTYCPHEKFQMRTVCGDGKREMVCTTLEQEAAFFENRTPEN